jgi:Carboxypeptidase regulatory-like domain
MTVPQPPRTISGVVLSEEGTPTKDAVVSLTSGPVPLPDIAAVTGEDGAFTLTAPATGQYAVTVVYPEGRQEIRTVEVPEPATDVALEVRPAAG